MVRHDSSQVLQRQLAACLVFSVLIGVIVAVLTIQHRHREWILRKEQCRHRLDVSFELLSREINRVRSDAFYLANRASLRRFVSGQVEGRSDLLDDLQLFVEQKSLYDQVRLLDLNGKEVIRVNFTENRATAVPDPLLQDKSDRYYFTESQSLRPGEVFVSEFDLNVEHGSIEQPLKPVIRFVTPVVDMGSKIRGYVVLNYLGQRLLDEFALPSVPGKTLLMRQDGHFIRGLLSSQEWGWLLGHDHTFPNLFPVEWRWHVGASTMAQLSDDGAFAFCTIPLERFTAAPPRNLREIHDTTPPRNGIVIASFIPRQQVFADSNQLFQRLAIFSGGILALAAIFTRAWARATWSREKQARQIADSELRLRELSSRLLRIQEDERRAISREIHDELGQQTTAINLDLHLALRNLETDQAEQHLRQAITENEVLLKTLQEFARRVRPTVLDDLGLANAIESHLTEFQRRTGAEVNLTMDLANDKEMPEEIADNAFRLIQESLNNVAKHADASQVDVTVRVVDTQHLHIIIRDNGRGRLPAAPSRGLGIVGMQERVDLLRGTLKIESADQAGTAVLVSLPLAAGIAT